MGRLFWKFFLFIWLAQLAGMFGVGAIFWLEHRRPEAPRQLAAPEDHRPPGPPPFGFEPDRRPPPPPSGRERGREPPPGPGLHIPFLPFLGALLASLGCAMALAWYFAKPIRRLRTAFEAAAAGNLEVRIGRDMDGRRDELADLGRDFDRMSERLGSLMDAQKRLLHDVSHEMRSPLARLQAAIGLARQQPPRLENSLARIECEGERMNALIGELLTLSRLDVGPGSEQEPVDLAALLADIAEAARFEGAARHVRVELVAGDLPEILAHAELLQRAIENVVRNALRFSPAGDCIRIEAGRTAGGIRLAIADHGPGVPEAELENIFQAFYRGEGQAAGTGYGLGLAIARRVIVAGGGRIRAENRATGGLLVEIFLKA